MASEEENRSTDDNGEDDGSSFALVAQFFLIPLAVVIIAIAIFVGFGLFTSEKHSPAEYLDEVHRGSLNRRWQAAFEFATLLAKNPELTEEQALFDKTLKTFETVEEQQVRRYLALALGRFHRPEAAPVLISALGDEDEETQLYAALALASLQDSSAIPSLIDMLGREQPSLRRTAAYALGHIGDAAAVPALEIAAEDRFFEVALQSSLALAQIGVPSGVPVLRKALNRKTFDEVASERPEQQMNEEQRADAMINAIRGLTLISDADAIPTLKALAAGDPALTVRDAALRAVEELSK